MGAAEEQLSSALARGYCGTVLLLLLGCPKLPVGHDVPAQGTPMMRPVYVPDPAVEARVTAKIAELAALTNAGDFMGARSMIDQIMTDEPENSWSGTLRAWQVEFAMVGQPAPPLAVQSWAQGGPPDSSQLQLVVFFEAWCSHCQQEMPILAAKSSEWAERGLAVVGITQQSRGVTNAELAAFLQASGVGFAIAVEDGGVSEAYRVTGIPSMAVTQGGTVVFRGHPSLLADSVLESWLAAPPR